MIYSGFHVPERTYSPVIIRIEDIFFAARESHLGDVVDHKINTHTAQILMLSYLKPLQILPRCFNGLVYFRCIDPVTDTGCAFAACFAADNLRDGTGPFGGGGALFACFLYKDVSGMDSI